MTIDSLDAGREFAGEVVLKVIRSAERVGPLSTVDKPEQTSIRLAEPVLVLFSIMAIPWIQLLPQASISCSDDGFRSVGDLELGEDIRGVVAHGLGTQ